MTLAEINPLIDFYNKQEENKRKQHAIDTYNTALFTAGFIGCQLAGKQVPSLYECFPDIFREEAEKQKQLQEQQELERTKAMLMQFTIAHNKQYKKKHTEVINND